MNNNTDPRPKSIFIINVSQKLGKEYTDLFNILVQYLVIQTIIQLMLQLTYPDCYSILSEDFITLILFMTVGILFFFLVIRKIVHFV